MNALNKTGRKILYSCEWPMFQGNNANYPLVAKTCNLYRNFYDIADSWNSVSSIIDFYGDNCKEFTKYNGPGNFFDADMLSIGNFGLSYDESCAQMAMLATWSSPLYMSNDLRDIAPDMKALLQNRKLIEVNQDSMGKMGTRVLKVSLS